MVRGDDSYQVFFLAVSQSEGVMQQSIGEEIRKAFELAFFIHPERKLALRITHSAASQWKGKLPVVTLSQRKRVYHRLIGRMRGDGAKVRVKARTMITFDESQRLQLLVYRQSEQIEKLQELAFLSPPKGDGPQLAGSQPLISDLLPTLTEADLAIRFIKHLIAITVRRNSFYVTLSISRMLHRYSYEQAIAIFDVIIQDPLRCKNDVYYRRQKRILMNEMKQRFGELLQTQRVSHNEERFLSLTEADAAQFIPLVKQALDQFTPWNTSCVLPARLDRSPEIEALNFIDPDPDKEHPVEASRMHTLIHPRCFERLMTALHFDDPNQKLEIPMFTSNRAASGDPSIHLRETPPPVTDDELKHIEDDIASQRQRRSEASPALISLVLDGREAEIIRLDSDQPIRLRLEESVGLLDIKTTDEQGELLLGSLLLDYPELLNAIPSREYRLKLADRRELLVTLAPILDSEGEIYGADITAVYCRVQSKATIADNIANVIAEPVRLAFISPVLTFSAVVVLLSAAAIGLILHRRQTQPTEYIAQVQTQPSPLSSPNPGQTDSNQRQQTKPEQPNRESPDAARRQPRVSPKNALGRNSPSLEGTRSLPGALEQELMSVRRVHVEPQASGTDGQISASFSRAINNIGTLRATNDATADAFLIWNLQGAGAAERIEVRLMNRNGQVLWTSSRSTSANRSAVITELVRELGVKIRE